MEKDNQLTKEARIWLNRSSVNAGDKTTMRDKLQGYLIALGLANGPCATRAAVWRNMAFVRAGDLRQFLKIKKGG